MRFYEKKKRSTIQNISQTYIKQNNHVGFKPHLIGHFGQHIRFDLLFSVFFICTNHDMSLLALLNSKFPCNFEQEEKTDKKWNRIFETLSIFERLCHFRVNCVKLSGIAGISNVIIISTKKILNRKRSDSTEMKNGLSTSEAANGQSRTRFVWMQILVLEWMSMRSMEIGLQMIRSVSYITCTNVKYLNAKVNTWLLAFRENNGLYPTNADKQISDLRGWYEC